MLIMKPTIIVHYYNGKQNIAHMAQLSCDEEYLYIQYDGKEQPDCYPIHQIEYMASVGKVRPALELPNDARVQFLDDNIPDWLPLKHKKMLHRVGHFEKSWKWVGIGFLTTAFVIVVMFKWGIPTAAHYVAHALPAHTLNDLGNQAEEIVNRLTSPSTLPVKRQQAISALYYEQLKPNQSAKIVFRKGGDLGANALAIPNNTIVLTDELVKLAKHDNEILAVLAHEQGHLVHRHSLQQALRGIGVGVFLLVITGDSSDLLSNVPVMLITAQYSQTFELEADRYAIDELKRLNISPTYLATMLQSLQQAHGMNENDTMQTLSTHPSTRERVEQINKNQ